MGSNAATFVGRHSQGLDTSAVLAGDRTLAESSFILMDFVEGIEMGVGAYFNGEDFLEPACLDWEHKRFFPGDLGELTGEMGTVVTYARTKSFFERTLAQDAAAAQGERLLRLHQPQYRRQRDGIWPLEFTCRFGYPGYAMLDPLQREPWGDLFRALIQRDRATVRNRAGLFRGYRHHHAAVSILS